jgi:rare lipoprotein A
MAVESAGGGRAMAPGRGLDIGRTGRRLAALVAAASVAACATQHPPAPAPGGPMGVNGTLVPYQVNGVWYRPHAQPDYSEEGIATWYGAQYHNRRTADGETFDSDRASAAHTTLPLPCIVEVTNLDNGRRIRVRVNDRGPFVRGRILDLSREGARELGFYDKGSARVRVRYVGPAPLDGGGGRIETAAFVAPPRPAPTATLAADPAPVAVSGTARVQAGAFADRGNAERAAAIFANAGGASILPLDRSGERLWRVVVNGQAGESGEALRERVAAAGFPGARLLYGGPGA